MSALPVCMCSWSYVNHAYGTQSREMAGMLWQNRRFKPIENEQGESQQALLNCAIRHRVARYDPHGGKSITACLKWISPAEKDRLDKAEPSPLCDADIMAIRETGTPRRLQPDAESRPTRSSAK